MASRFHPTQTVFVWLALLAVLLAGCSTPTAVTPAGATPSTPSNTDPAVTSTPLTPTPTPEPMAAWVNTQGVLQAEFDAELLRYQAAQQQLSQTQEPAQQRALVLEDLIDQTLLAQAAQEGGFVPDEAMLRARLDQLSAQIGGADALAAWQAEHGYSPETFNLALKRTVAAAWQRDQIMASVPATGEQVHVRQILVYDRVSAENALLRLVPGLDFATLAFKYDRITGGDLGWFPRGYLIDPLVEEAAFGLTQPDQISAIIEGRTGFHILQLIERDADRILSPDARLVLQKQALSDWVQSRRDQSQIEIVSP